MVAIFFSLVVLSCASLPSKSSSPAVNPAKKGAVQNSETAESRFWHSLPARDGLVFIGSAGVRSNRDDSIKLALQDIARKVSIFSSVEGEFVAHHKTGSGFFDFTADTKTSLAFNEDYQGYVESLDFDPDTDVIQYENSIFVRARYNGSGSIPINYELFNGTNGSKPSWIDNPPKEISGYTVGVGFASRRAVHRDTVNASFEAAIFSVIKEISSQITGGDVNYQGNGTFDYRTTNENTITARGVLNNFYVLDTWIDKSNKAVWTLAVARVSTP
ncbi:hypothetical protein LQZ19_13835 [Treponema primitia]|uniref:hypothetical protein n=1 Tax=Treponema primitia TaxID=88058 RepID=UPI0039809D8D